MFKNFIATLALLGLSTTVYAQAPLEPFVPYSLEVPAPPDMLVDVDALSEQIIIIGGPAKPRLSAGVIVAIPCTDEAIQAAHDAATAGATILVAAGSCTWDTAITFTKKINLVGSGCTVDADDRPTACTTQITLEDLADPAISLTLGTTNSSVSYFAMSTTTLTGTVAAFISSNGSDGTARIHHNLFTNDVPGTTSNRRCVYMSQGSGLNGPLPIALIDHNVFMRCRVSMYAATGVSGPDGQYSRDPAANPHPMGEFNQPIIENNTIDHTGHIQGNCIELDRGASATVRFNDIVECPVEAHTMSAGATAGGYAFEVYENDWASCYGDGGNVSVFLRSGGSIFFSNTFPSAALDCQTPLYIENSTRSTTAGQCDGSNALDWNLGSGSTYPAAGWPCFNQTGFGSYFETFADPNPGMYKTPVPIFLNRKGASISIGTPGTGVDKHIADCHEIQNEDATFDGSCGTGVGTRAEMDAIDQPGAGKCTSTTEVDPLDAGTIPGTSATFFWVTDEGSWNTLLSVNTSGRLYRCKSDGTGFELFYTPYTYPAGGV